MNDRPTRFLVILVLVTAAAVLVPFVHHGSTGPLTNAQLAQAIEKDAAGDWSTAHVTCHTLADPGPEGADRTCTESLMGDFCAAPSSPSHYQLAIRVDGGSYTEVERLTESSGDCTAF